MFFLLRFKRKFPSTSMVFKKKTMSAWECKPTTSSDALPGKAQQQQQQQQCRLAGEDRMCGPTLKWCYSSVSHSDRKWTKSKKVWTGSPWEKRNKERQTTKPWFSCPHTNTEKSRRFPKASFSLTWNAVYVCMERPKGIEISFVLRNALVRVYGSYASLHRYLWKITS